MRWFCEVGGTILAVLISPVVAELVAVVEQAARRLGDPVADRRPRSRLDRRRIGRLVGIDQPHGLVACVEDLHRTDHDALERVAAAGADAGLLGSLGERTARAGRG